MGEVTRMIAGAGSGPPAAAPGSSPPRRGRLALALQEAFTVTVRLRAERQVAADAGSFRAQVKQLLAAADQDARRAGYEGEHVKLAVYAFIAFLDESVLNSHQPMFADWHRQPLQEEIFGDLMAGENFFRYLRDLLGRQDSEDLADLLEVYQLCLLLGFKGRYGADAPGELRGLESAVRDKILRIRGAPGPLSPAAGHPAGEEVPPAGDPWMRPLTLALAGAALFAVVLFVVFSLSLRSGTGQLRTLVAGLVS